MKIYKQIVHMKIYKQNGRSSSTAQMDVGSVWNKVIMKKPRKFLRIVKITYFKKHLKKITNYQDRHSFLLPISKLFSLFNFIFCQTNRTKMDLPT